MAASSFRLIVGLGNPGAEYRDTRHNAGFWFVDRLADGARAGWQRQSRQHCELARVRLGAHELWLMKPTTFMNGSGAAVQSVAAFYRIAPAEMLVVHDEIDLSPGTVRLKFAGGHGGHNGLRDIIACVGAEFWRLRLGVGHPGDKDRVVDAVLSRASSAEQQLIDKALVRGIAALPLLLDGASQAAMHQLHTHNDEPAAS